MKKKLNMKTILAAVLLALLLPLIGLPSTGYIVADRAPSSRMWRIAMFAIYPTSFFMFVGAVMIPLLTV